MQGLSQRVHRRGGFARGWAFQCNRCYQRMKEHACSLGSIPPLLSWALFICVQGPRGGMRAGCSVSSPGAETDLLATQSREPHGTAQVLTAVRGAGGVPAVWASWG